MRVLDHPGSLLGLLLLLVAPGGEAAGSPQAKVDCICHNEDYVICEWGRQQKPVHNYSFYYWFENFSQPGECEKYRQIDGLNVACQLSEYEPFNYLKMYLNNSQDQNVVREAVLLNNRVRPGRPFNLTLHNLSNHQLLLTWDTLYKKARCLQNAVRYKSNKDTQWMEYQVKSMEFQIPSVDPKKHYTFYVKSKLHDNCATTDLWSEESNPIFWGKEDVSPASLPFSLKDVAIPLGSIVLLLLLLGLLRMERTGLESPKTCWRASGPAIMKTSAPSLSCCPAATACLQATRPQSRPESCLTLCQTLLPKPTWALQHLPPEFAQGAPVEGGSPASRAPPTPHLCVKGWNSARKGMTQAAPAERMRCRCPG